MVTINIQKKDLYLLIILVVLVGSGIVVAYNSDYPNNPINPTVQGHTNDEIGLPNCAEGQVIKKGASGWECLTLSQTATSGWVDIPCTIYASSCLTGDAPGKSPEQICKDNGYNYTTGACRFDAGDYGIHTFSSIGTLISNNYSYARWAISCEWGGAAFAAPKKILCIK